MSKRAIIIGIVFAAVLCSITYFNQAVMRQSALVCNYLPISVYGPLILVVLLVNPLIGLVEAGKNDARPWLRGACYAAGFAFILSGATSAIAMQSWMGLLVGFIVAAPVFGISWASTVHLGEWRATVTAVASAVVTGLVVFCFAGGGAALVAAAGVATLAGLMTSGQPFEGSELAVMLALVLAACGVAESGFIKTFANVAMLPHHYRKANPGWDQEGTFERLPKHFLAKTGEEGAEDGDEGAETGEEDAEKGDEGKALGDFVQGRITEGPFSIKRDVPWSAWMPPLLTWLPLVILLMAAFVGLALVIHRQWAEHERLPYPLATFARSLWAADGEESVLAHRGFWVAAGIVLAIHMVNFIHTWWPESTIEIPTRFDFYSVTSLFKTFARGGIAWNLSQFRIFFSVVGFAYLVSSDVSLSFGIAPFIYAILDGILATYGISTMAGGEHRASIYTSVNIGSCVAFVMMIAYFGRRHYWAVLKSCFGMAPADTPRPHETWGMRAFVTCAGFATILMISYGLAWPFAIIFMLSIMVFYVAVSRVVAETGLFFMKPAWVPHIMLLGLFGGYALGPTAALIAMFFSAILFAEARETIMPYVVNSLGLLSREKVKLGRVAIWAGGAVTIGLIVGVVVTLCIQNDRGTDMAAGSWFTRWVPSYPFDISTSISQRLRGQGTLAASDAMPSWKRPFNARPNGEFMISFAVGAALVVLCYVGRIHVRKWPIHPAVFMLWNWFHASSLTFSFLLGWAIKTAVAKYGGWRTAQRVKPIMIGLIAGAMLGALVPAIISAVYYLASGELPPSFKILPS